MGGEESGPQFPDLLRYLWHWFVEISDGTPSNGMAPIMFGWLELKAWAEMMDIGPAPWEARLLIALSALRATIIAEQWAREDKNRTHR